MERHWISVDGNAAAARVAYALSEVVPIFPITPASPMAEAAGDWAAAGKPNLWGAVPEVVEMQSEAGAAAALHGALQKGALATTFTASQGLLLMIPGMFKIAGELTPTVMHVAARTVATHALSIFGDHSDVMQVRTTGWAMLASSSVQEAQDLALVAHIATLRSRVPFVHFFDGFRTSHEIDKIVALEDADLDALFPEDELLALRARGLTPEAPVLRGSSQNPDAFFQAREAANPFHDAVPGIVAQAMAAVARRTARRYDLVEYSGAPDAERVIVIMGSGVGAAEEAVETLVAAGERVGVLKLRLYRPFPAGRLVDCLPRGVRGVAVLDRTKEPGSCGEPLHLDVLAALARDAASPQPRLARMPRVIGGRYGLSSKEFTPAMVKAVFDELAAERPRERFTVGITDDVTHLSLPVGAGFRHQRPAGEVQAVFYGLGADGTVSANKSSIKIIGESTPLWAQGYFVYDSKKSGSVTVSHLRFGPAAIRSTYLIDEADFVACHQFGLLERTAVLDRARDGATFLLNSPFAAYEVWPRLPGHVRRQIVDKHLDMWVIDADRIAQEAGLGGRINTVMQACFFALSGIMPTEDAIARIKESVEKSYGRRGPVVVEQNVAAIDRALEGLVRVTTPEEDAGAADGAWHVPDDAPDFVRRVTARLMAGEGDLLPVSAFPVDGTFPTGTSKYEKRAIARYLPIWDPDVCIGCAKCSMVCPHATIRIKAYEPAVLDEAPPGFPHRPWGLKEQPALHMTVQVAPDDCTGCGVCVDVCPAKSKAEVRHKALNLAPAAEVRDAERAKWSYFATIPLLARDVLPHDSVRGSQVLEPLFEFSGACAGCGETPYLRLVSQLFGDRIVVAAATGCSSIYGGNLPTTPWTVDREGRGPAWNNSLFEDAAEFGYGMRLGWEAQLAAATALLERLAADIDANLTRDILTAAQETEPEIRAQRERVSRLMRVLEELGTDRRDVRRLLALAPFLVRTGVWIVGGDGWAYDIGYGGLDHVLASGRDVNVLVLDTEVYSNTGGQASKATSRAAVAKFAAGGKATAKKDLGAIARAYGNVYVAQIAMGANDTQAVRALLEAEAWPGPSLVIAYSTCIAHGIDMSKSMTHMKDAVRSGYWPLYRFHPSPGVSGQPFTLDSREPSIPFSAFASTEVRFAVLGRMDPERAEALMDMAQADIAERWRFYSQLSAIERTVPTEAGSEPQASGIEPEVESDAGYRYNLEGQRWNA